MTKRSRPNYYCDKCHNSLFKNIANIITQQKVKIISPTLASTFGLKINKVYKIKECPKEYKNLFPNSIWIFSEIRNELVRCLPREYEFINNLVNKS